MTEVTCFAANTSFKFILGAVYIHPGASMQDIGMLLWQGLGPYIHNSQYVPPFVQVDSSIPILLCGDFNKNLLTDHFCPKPNVIVQRYNFNKRNQGTESVSAYVAELRKLSENCEFIDLDELSDVVLMQVFYRKKCQN
ncbi:hypothetical protein LAZ67_23000045 [Cordylochernes scorpioides]|uniref:Retrotransposon gag domain-containing protein n=1 Tax=Cordylochernes scorpioides TaxID=51811 RepID=A0ABY6LTV5_9ARAC|nr:hypothetical protein LAZ67_23000045 [Cordylochernes scorpioides]